MGEVARRAAGALSQLPVTVMVRESDDARRREADDGEDRNQVTTRINS